MSDISKPVIMLFAGIRVCQRLVATPTMKSIGAEPTDLPSKFCDQHDFDSDSYWECMIRRNAISVYHPCGTARMGDVKDSTTVVDSKLRWVDPRTWAFL